MKKPAVIEVHPCKQVFVSGVDLQEGDRYVVHRVVDSECDITVARDIPFSPHGAVVFLDNTHNPIVLDMPGKYRVYPDGVVSPTAELWFDEQNKCEAFR